MSKLFPHGDPDNPGELVEVTYFDSTEVASLLNTTARHVRQQCASGRWPHLKQVDGRTRYWMNGEDIARVMARLRHDPDAMFIQYDEDAHHPHLTIALSDVDMEAIQ
jgi:hypothetical protein